MGRAWLVGHAGLPDSPAAANPSIPATHARTLDDYLRSRSPGLDVVRLVLAFLVLVSHTWPLGGFGAEPLVAVDVARVPDARRLRRRRLLRAQRTAGRPIGADSIARRRIARARVVRIVPAYWTALVVGGFVVAALGWIHAHDSLSGFMTLDPGGPVGHVLRGALFPTRVLVRRQRRVHHRHAVRSRARATSFVNGSLWTLPHEMRCYFVIGVVAVAARRFGGEVGGRHGVGR